MPDFGLLILGHLVGDYIVQTDWMATNKVNRHPGPDLSRCKEDRQVWKSARSAYHNGHVACFVHCLCYTAAVWAFNLWLPWWALLACFAVHFPIDRFSLAKWWMLNVSGQKVFATGPLSPWSVIVVDNTFHLLTLWLLWRVSFLG